MSAEGSSLRAVDIPTFDEILSRYESEPYTAFRLACERIRFLERELRRTPSTQQNKDMVAADEIEQLRAALEVIGLPAHVPNGFDPLEWWKHTTCKRGEIARDALGVTAEELIAKKWHEHVEATR